MRRILALAVVLLMPSLVQAEVISETGTLVSTGQSTENGFILVYSFAPLSIPGDNISFRLDYNGFISPRVGGATGINIATGNTITSVNVIPSASFASSLLSGPSVGFPNSPTVQSAVVSEAYDNLNNVSVSPFAVPVSLSGTSGPGVPNDYFSTTNLAAVSLFAVPATPFVIEPPGSTATFPGGVSIDRSTGSVGTLVLTVNYNPVPEPASMAILGVGLVGLTVLGRRRSV